MRAILCRHVSKSRGLAFKPFRAIVATTTVPSTKFSSDSKTAAIRQHAIDEVRHARRKERETEDEACLFNAAHEAACDTTDSFSAALGKDPSTRRRAIDIHIARQVALLMGSLAGPGFRPGVPPPGMTFAIEVRESPIQDAGKGLFVVGSGEEPDGEVIAKKGDVLAFYPGTVYTTSELALCGGYGAALERAGSPSPDYMLGRKGLLFDGLGSGFVVGSSESSPSWSSTGEDAQLEEALALRDAGGVGGGVGGEGEVAAAVSEPRCDAWPLPDGTAVAGMKNGWANGHFANHPPKGKHATVIGWPYDFPPQIPERLLPFLPNTYALKREADPSPRLCRHTIVLVAACDLRSGDECFLDYGFEHAPTNNNNNQTTSASGDDDEGGGGIVDRLPSWFTPAKFRGDVLVTEEDDDDDDEDDEVEGGEGEAQVAHGSASDGAEMKENPKKKKKKKKKQASPLEVARSTLLDWRQSFESREGRAATRHDLQADPVAAALFEEFSRLNKLEWAEEDE